MHEGNISILLTLSLRLYCMREMKSFILLKRSDLIDPTEFFVVNRMIRFFVYHLSRQDFSFLFLFSKYLFFLKSNDKIDTNFAFYLSSEHKDVPTSDQMIME